MPPPRTVHPKAHFLDLESEPEALEKSQLIQDYESIKGELEDGIEDSDDDAPSRDELVHQQALAEALVRRNFLLQDSLDAYKTFLVGNWQKGAKQMVVSGAFSKHMKQAMERAVPPGQHFYSEDSEEVWLAFLKTYSSILVLLPTLRKYRFALDRKTLQLVHFCLTTSFARNRHFRVTSTFPKTLCTILLDMTGLVRYDEINDIQRRIFLEIRQIYVDCNPSMRRKNFTFTPKTEVAEAKEASHDPRHPGSILLGRYAEPIFGLPVFVLPACSICHEQTTEPHTGCPGLQVIMSGFQYLKEVLLPVRTDQMKLGDALIRPKKRSRRDQTAGESTVEKVLRLENLASFPNSLAGSISSRDLFLSILQSVIDPLESKISASIEALLDGFHYSIIGNLANLGDNVASEGSHYEYYGKRRGWLTTIAGDFVTLFENTEACIYTLLAVTNSEFDLGALKLYYYSGPYRALRPLKELFHFVSGSPEAGKITFVRTICAPRLYKKLYGFFTVLRDTYITVLGAVDTPMVFLRAPEWLTMKSVLQVACSYAEFKAEFRKLFGEKVGQLQDVFLTPNDAESRLFELELYRKCLSWNTEWYGLLEGEDMSIKLISQSGQRKEKDEENGLKNVKVKKIGS